MVLLSIMPSLVWIKVIALHRSCGKTISANYLCDHDLLSKQLISERINSKEFETNIDYLRFKFSQEKKSPFTYVESSDSLCNKSASVSK